MGEEKVVTALRGLQDLLTPEMDGFDVEGHVAAVRASDSSDVPVYGPARPRVHYDPTPVQGAVCEHCGGRWIILSRDVDSRGDLHSVLAAHDCDGIGVLASWRRAEDGWRVLAADTEHAEEVTAFGEEECVPATPPVAAEASGAGRVL